MSSHVDLVEDLGSRKRKGKGLSGSINGSLQGGDSCGQESRWLWY